MEGAKWVQECASTQPQTTWEFQYSPESFTGTELDFAIDVVDAMEMRSGDRGTARPW